MRSINIREGFEEDREVAMEEHLNLLLSDEAIISRIYTLRGMRVMIDRDLAIRDISESRNHPDSGLSEITCHSRYCVISTWSQVLFWEA